MDETYLIEIRLARTKWRVKEIISAIARVHNLTDLMERHPHLTLYGPLTLNVGTGEDLLLGTVERVASRYGPVPFTIGGFEKREGMHGSVVAFSVKPSVSLRALAKEIAGAVSPLSVSQNAWDAVHDHKWYHVTVANRLDRPAAAAVYDALCPAREPCSGPAPSGPGQAVPAWQDPGTGRIKPRISPLLIDEAGLRITVMRGEEILAEYDLPGKRWITGSDIYDGRAWQETLALYRRSAGFETAGRPAGDRKDIFFIGDLHLGHANIIRYCSRPFSPSDPGEMDRVLIA
ncbi:MAG TPA: 2'-5' RNA ligase family protein, partial [Methanoregula sp.]|nr:2'-5' RNA ligase family protein [Methanoregula sp.]